VSTKGVRFVNNVNIWNFTWRTVELVEGDASVRINFYDSRMRGGQIYQQTSEYYYRRIIILFLLAFAATLLPPSPSSNLPGDPKLSFVKFTCLESKISLLACSTNITLTSHPCSFLFSFFLIIFFFYRKSSMTTKWLVSLPIDIKRRKRLNIIIRV